MTTYRVKRLEDVIVFFFSLLPFKINGLRVYQWMLFVLARHRPITWHPGEILNSQWWGTGRGPALGQKIASEPIALKPSWSWTTGILPPSAYVLTLSLCFAYWTSFMSWNVKSCQVKVPPGQNSRSDQNAFSVWTQHLFSASLFCTFNVSDALSTTKHAGILLCSTSKCVPSIWPGCCNFPLVRYGVHTCCKDASEVSTGCRLRAARAKRRDSSRSTTSPSSRQHSPNTQGVKKESPVAAEQFVTHSAELGYSCQANYFFEKNWWKLNLATSELGLSHNCTISDCVHKVANEQDSLQWTNILWTKPGP